MAEKTSIRNTDPDFEDYWVRVHGSPIGNVLSADAERGEVWVHYEGEPTKALELKIGTVTIVRRREAEPQAPASSRRRRAGGAA